MKELWNFFDKARSELRTDEIFELATVMIVIEKADVLRNIAGDVNVIDKLLWQIKNLEYSDLVKEKLMKKVTTIASKVKSSMLIDLMLDMAKTLEVYKAIEVFDSLVEQAEEIIGNMKASKAQTAIVSQYFNVESNSKVFSGRIGKGFEISQLLSNKKDIAIYAQDFVSEDLIIAEIRLRLLGHKNFEMKRGNILTSPLFKNEKFDYVLDTPRFGYKPKNDEIEQLKLDPRFSFYGIPSKMNADLGFVVAGTQVLNEQGKGAFYLTTGALFRGGADQKIRERFIEKDEIDVVIEFPSGLLAPATSISTALLLINKNKCEKAKGNILFINATKFAKAERRKTVLTEEGLSKIISIIENRQEVKGISKIVDRNDLVDFELLPSRYVFDNEIELDEYGKVEINLAAYDQLKTIALKNIAQIYRGFNASPKDESATGNVALLKISDIVEGEILEAGLTRYQLGGRVKLDNYRLQKGDIVLSIRGQLKLAIFESDRDDVLLSQNFVGIRCHSEFNPHFVKLYLESPTMQFIMQNSLTGSTILNLSVKDIEGFKIPLLPLDEQQKIVQEYNEKQKELKVKLEEILRELRTTKLNAYEQMGIRQTFTIK